VTRATANDLLFVSQTFSGPNEFAMQLIQIGTTHIPQLDSFEIIPDALVGIEIGSIPRQLFQVQAFGRCDALLLDENARADTYPTIRVEENQTEVGHEAMVSKVGDDQLFYLMSQGLDESETSSLIVNGFIEPIARELPMKYSIELKPPDPVGDVRQCRLEEHAVGSYSGDKGAYRRGTSRLVPLRYAPLSVPNPPGQIGHDLRQREWLAKGPGYNPGARSSITNFWNRAMYRCGSCP
jgi:hypothetical protein